VFDQTPFPSSRSLPSVDTTFGLRCDVAVERDRARVSPAGELDIATAPQLEEALRPLLRPDGVRVVIDLRRLSFIDSTGLKLILRCNEAARRSALGFGLIAGPPAVQRIFEVTGTLGLFDFDQRSALAWASRSDDRRRAGSDE